MPYEDSEGIRRNEIVYLAESIHELLMTLPPNDEQSHIPLGVTDIDQILAALAEKVDKTRSFVANLQRRFEKSQSDIKTVTLKFEKQLAHIDELESETPRSTLTPRTPRRPAIESTPRQSMPSDVVVSKPEVEKLHRGTQTSKNSKRGKSPGRSYCMAIAQHDPLKRLAPVDFGYERFR